MILQHILGLPLLIDRRLLWQRNNQAITTINTHNPHQNQLPHKNQRQSKLIHLSILLELLGYHPKIRYSNTESQFYPNSAMSWNIRTSMPFCIVIPSGVVIIRSSQL